MVWLVTDPQADKALTLTKFQRLGWHQTEGITGKPDDYLEAIRLHAQGKSKAGKRADQKINGRYAMRCRLWADMPGLGWNKKEKTPSYGGEPTIVDLAQKALKVMMKSTYRPMIRDIQEQEKVKQARRRRLRAGTPRQKIQAVAEDIADELVFVDFQNTAHKDPSHIEAVLKAAREKVREFHQRLDTLRQDVHPMPKLPDPRGEPLETLAVLRSWCIDEGNEPAAKPAAPAGKSKRGPKAATPHRRNYRLPTKRQLEVLVMMEDCGGNIREAARRLNLAPNTVSQHYKAGLLNSGKARAALTHHGRMKALPKDARGQVAVGTPRRAR
jgi:hypothetical protein